MKLGESKLALAKVINEHGGWVDDTANWAVQPKHENGDVWFSTSESKPYNPSGELGFTFKGQGSWLVAVAKFDKVLPNWHQCVLSREEYYHAHPKADADGWIEWNGGECPVSGDDIVDVAYSTYGAKSFSAEVNSLRWSKRGLGGDIIAYRPHKPEVKPEFCESVMRSIPEPEAKPSIEQLAAYYRNAKDYAERKQQEADAAKADADEKLRVLEIAGEALGLLVSPITEKQEPGLVITRFTGKFHSTKHGDQPSSLDAICDGCGKRFGTHVGFDCRP